MRRSGERSVTIDSNLRQPANVPHNTYLPWKNNKKKFASKHFFKSDWEADSDKQQLKGLPLVIGRWLTVTVKDSGLKIGGDCQSGCHTLSWWLSPFSGKGVIVTILRIGGDCPRWNGRDAPSWVRAQLVRGNYGEDQIAFEFFTSTTMTTATFIWAIYHA